MKTNICIVSPYIPPDFAGAGKRAFNQAKYIASTGQNTIMLTTTKSNINIKNLEVITINIPHLSKKNSLLNRLFRIMYSIILLLKILYIIINRKIDLVHCIPGYTPLSLISIISGKLLGKQVVSETTLDGSDDPVSIRRSTLGFIKLKIFNLSDVIVNISPLLHKSCKEMKVKSESIIIANSVDNEKYTKPNLIQKEILRKKLKLDQEGFILLYVGILQERKGVVELLEMFRKVNKQIDKSYLILAGPQDKNRDNVVYTKEVKGLIERYDLENKVLLPGEINNTDEWMKASDVFVFASKREGFGTVLIEAMSSGLPVLSTEIPNITNYIIKDNYDGIIIKNKEEFVKSVVKLYQDNRLYKYISQNAVDTVDARFSNDVILSKYMDLYKRLIQKDD